MKDSTYRVTYANGSTIDLPLAGVRAALSMVGVPKRGLRAALDCLDRGYPVVGSGMVQGDGYAVQTTLRRVERVP